VSEKEKVLYPKAIAYGFATFASFCLIGSMLIALNRSMADAVFMMHPLMLIISGYVAGYHARHHATINGLVTGAIAPLGMIIVVPFLLWSVLEPGRHDITLFGSGFAFLVGPIGLVVLLEGVVLSTFGGKLRDLQDRNNK